MTTRKDTNPKDAVGTGKVPASCHSARVMGEVDLAMLEGGRKYGRHNYRVAGVRGSVYYDAALRHLGAWWEGQDIDPDSGLSHVTKAIASLMVLRDSQLQGNWVDDRPPKTSDINWIAEQNAKAKAIIERYPDAVDAFTEVGEQAKKVVEAAEPIKDESDAALEDAFAYWLKTGHCGLRAQAKPFYFCTRSKGHAGEHVGVDDARPGPCMTIQRWPAEPIKNESIFEPPYCSGPCLMCDRQKAMRHG